MKTIEKPRVKKIQTIPENRREHLQHGNQVVQQIHPEISNQPIEEEEGKDRARSTLKARPSNARSKK
jgi:hypothetical protein